MQFIFIMAKLFDITRSAVGLTMEIDKKSVYEKKKNIRLFVT